MFINPIRTYNNCSLYFSGNKKPAESKPQEQKESEDKKVKDWIMPEYGTRVFITKKGRKDLPAVDEGRAESVKKAFSIDLGGERTSLFRFEDGSFLINPETETKFYYGKPAIDFLNKTTNFDVDTQIIFPKGSKGTLYKNGKEIKLSEDSAIQITAGTKNAVIKLDENSTSPLVYTSKEDFEWYERYEKDSINPKIHAKYVELMDFASNLYNEEFTPNIMLPPSLKNDQRLEEIGIKKWEAKNNLISELCEKIELLTKSEQKELLFVKGIVDKLEEKGLVDVTEDGFLKPKHGYVDKYRREELEKEGFSQKEIDKIAPVLLKARQAKIDSRFSRRNNASSYGDEIVKKMKKAGLFLDNKNGREYVYWKNVIGTEEKLRSSLQNAKDKEGNPVIFSDKEVEKIVKTWYREDTVGFDMSGMKYIDEDLAVYYLDDKLNNWTQEETNWVTNSTSISSTKGKVPSIGASIVRCDKPGITSMDTLRMGEALHKHPNKKNLKQYEVYFVTQGQEVLDIRENGVKQTIVLNAGDLAIIQPNVEHCVNVVRGKYEHVCAQIPSAFHHGFGLKKLVKDDEDREARYKRGEKAIMEENA